MTQLLLGMLVQCLLGAFANLGFAVWFRVPRRILWLAVLIGTAGFLVRQLLHHFGEPQLVASFWAAFVIGVLGLYRARSTGQPRVVFTVTGVIPLVPGIPAYESMVHFTQGNIVSGMDNAIRATVIVAALAGGLTVARILTLPRRSPH